MVDQTTAMARRHRHRWRGTPRRRRRAIAVLTVALACNGALAAYGLWGKSVPVSTATLRSGTFGITAVWSTTPNVSGLMPGQSRDGVISVTHTGNGTWRYSVSSTFTGTLRPTLTETFYAGGVCTGTPLTPGALSAQTYARGATTQICVRYALPSGAPSTLQGATSQITITVGAENRPT